MEDLNSSFKCDDVELYYYDFICDDNTYPIPAEIVDHINSCEICLGKIEKLKAMLEQPENAVESHNAEVRNEINHILERHFAYTGKHVSCNDVKPFLPYQLDADLEIKIPTPITVHLNSCAKCHQDLEAIRSLSLDETQLSILVQAISGDIDSDTMAVQLLDSQLSYEKMQQLTDAISTISQRRESDIITVCHIDKDAKAANDDSNLYAGFPIAVEQIDNSSVEEHNTKATIPFKTNAASKSTNARLLRSGIIAAAVILIAAGLFFSTPTVKAVSIGNIYRAMEKIKGAYIANFAPDAAEPMQEFWISRERNVYITKVRNKTVFYDLDNAQQKMKSSDMNMIESNQITQSQASIIKQGMYSFFGVMPFANISDIPVDAQWNDVTDEMPKNDGDVEIYDLIWKDQETRGGTGYRKYKFYVDPATDLPFKIEVYIKLSLEEDYTLENLILVKYLDSNEFEAVVREKGF